MKKIYISLTLLLLPLLSAAQSKIAYAYDAAGNRVKREIVMQAPQAMAKMQAMDPEAQVFSDMISEYSVKIYPNPTEGALRIGIAGLKDTDNCTLGIYTTQGAQVLTEHVTTERVDLNIMNQPTGIYLLRIVINGKSTTWKIIKK